jgi:hypothetical protein
MKRVLPAVKHVLLAACLIAGGPAIADVTMARFTFKVPEGWADKSPESHAVTIVVNEKEGLVFNASVAPGADPVDDELLDKWAADSVASFKRLMPAGTMTLRKKERVTIAGITCGRFQYDTNPGGDREAVRQLQFYIPVEDQHAVLTYTASPEKFAAAMALFDRLARATKVRK